MTSAVVDPFSGAGAMALGERNATLFRMACQFRRQGHDELRIFEQIAAVNKTQCDPPLEECEARAIAKSAAAYGLTRNVRRK